MNAPRVLETLPGGEAIVGVPPEMYHKVLDVLERAFPDVPRSFFYAIAQNDPSRHSRFCLAVQTGNRLTAHVQIFDRTLILDGTPVRFAGIGSVGTHPNFRGRGYGTALMRRAARIIEDEGMDGGMLYTKIHPYYERLGWRAAPQWEQVVPLDRAATPEARLETRPIQLADIPELHALYERNQPNLSGTLARSPAYWKARVTWMNHTGVAVIRHGRIIGYFYGARYNPSDPALSVSEFGHRGGGEEMALLAGAMARLAAEKRCTSLRGFFRPDPVFGAFLDERGWIETERPYPYVMWLDAPGSGVGGAIRKAAAERRFVYWQTDAF